MRAWGAPYIDFERRGIMVPVTEAQVRWVHPARYDDLLDVETRVEQLTPARIVFAYRISRTADGTLCCEGSTTHGFLGPGAGPAPCPSWRRTCGSCSATACRRAPDPVVRMAHELALSEALTL